MQVYVATVSYDDPQNVTHNGIAGVFSSEERAQAGLENFVESVLEIEFSDYRNLTTEVQAFELDRNWLDIGDGVL
jgi:hypothetical protein